MGHAGARVRGSDVMALGLFAALAVALAAPLLPQFSTAIPSDIGDPLLNTWILWWNAQTAPWAADYWNAPAFAPAPYALALSENLLGLTPITTPLQWLGAIGSVGSGDCAKATVPAKNWITRRPDVTTASPLVSFVIEGPPSPVLGRSGQGAGDEPAWATAGTRW